MLTPQKTQQGFSLIEMLVAGFVITFGLVGMVLMQGHTQRNAFNAHNLSLAGLYAQDLQERLRANVCYLSSLANDSQVQGFLDDQQEQWEADHSLVSRNWVTSIAPLNVVTDFSNNDPEAYWRFDLEISGQGIEMTQRLLVEHVSGDCQP